MSQFDARRPLERLTLNEARQLSVAVGHRGELCALEAEVGALFTRAIADGEWTAGSLLVGPEAVRVNFVASAVGGLRCGQRVWLEGTWVRHPECGVQLRVERCVRSKAPTETASLIRYLVANVEGLGERRATHLVRVIGAEAAARIHQSPASARAVFRGAVGEQVERGIRALARELADEAWITEVAPRLLAVGDISGSLVRRIVVHFGGAQTAEAAISRDPYRLLDVTGVEWRQVDAVALADGVELDAPERLEAAVRWAMKTVVRAGDSAASVRRLMAEVGSLVPGHDGRTRVAVMKCIEFGDAVRSQGLLYTQCTISEEWAIAELMLELRERRYELARAERSTVRSIIAQNNLSEEQSAAIWQVLTHGVTVLTGAPGTGKTHVLRALLDAADALGVKHHLCAPTGRAAARAAELSGHAASTVHRLLGAREGELRPKGPIGSGLLVLEEASMVDAPLMAWLCRNVAPETHVRLLIVGDEHQLPPVRHGQVLVDLISSGAIHVSRLTKPRRQDRASQILVQAERLRRGEALGADETYDWRIIPLPKDAAAAHKVVLAAVRRVIAEEQASLLRRDRGFDPRRELQVLAPINAGCLNGGEPHPLGVVALNSSLRTLLNPRGKEGPYIDGGVRARVGDRVVCLHNDYSIAPGGLMNGEQALVERLDADSLNLLLDDGRRVTLRGQQVRNVALAFAMTVHRAQGSEYPVVVAVYHRSHWPLVEPRVLYTAITRARERVVLCADPDALERAVGRDRFASERCTGLARRLATAAGRAVL